MNRVVTCGIRYRDGYSWGAWCRTFVFTCYNYTILYKPGKLACKTREIGTTSEFERTLTKLPCSRSASACETVALAPKFLRSLLQAASFVR